ncbi:Vitamin B6 transporter [Xanthoria parietina]
MSNSLSTADDAMEDTSRPPSELTRSKFYDYTRDFERSLIKYNIEARGVRRVLPQECHPLTWRSYLQTFLLWFSGNLAAQNTSLGMLGPTIFALSFRDACLCAFFGSLIGATGPSYIATFGPISGNRTLIFARYTFGWYPSKLLVILNLIVLLGYNMIGLVIAGQILSAVSVNGSMSIVVGIIIVAIVSWVITTFGISVFHTYQRYAFIPALIAFSILYGVSSHNYDLSTPSQGDSRTVVGSRISFLSLTLSAAITYGGTAADFFVYYPPTTAPVGIFSLSLLGLLCSFTFAYCVGIGLASGILSIPAYGTAYAQSQGALIVAGFTESTSPSNFNTGFGKFLSVVIAFSLVANIVLPTYSSGIDFQILGKNFEKIPRVVWNSVGVIICTVCALAGRDHLAEIFTNFLALMGYWVIIWIGITLEEQFLFRSRFGFRTGIRKKEDRRGWGQDYDWTCWNQPEGLPLGIAALASFLVGWSGAILCMAQYWYTGPIAKLIGEHGADLGNFVGLSWAILVYPPLRWLEVKRFGR